MTEGQTPAGWYDDGRGQLRWYDGTTWTEHVHPLPTPAAPPVQEQPVQQAAAPVAAAPVAAAPVAQQAPAVATPESTAAAAFGAPGSHTQGDPWVEPTPIYRKPWFLAVVGLVVLAVIAGIFLVSTGGDDEPNAVTPAPRASTPVATSAAPTTGTGTGTSAFGADAATVAAKAGCAVSATIPPTTSTAPGAAPTSKVACTLNGTLYTVVTWASAADQTATGSLAKAFTQPVTAGTKYYATGEGWTAFDTAYDKTAAEAFATPAGGTVKGVVVVLSSSPAPATTP